MIRKEAINQRFYKNFFIISVILAFAIAAASLCIIYYWSFYHYNHIFEDRIIDEAVVFDSGRYYQLISAKNGAPRQLPDCFEKGFFQFGAEAFNKRDPMLLPLMQRYLCIIEKKLQRAALSGGRPKRLIFEAESTARLISAFLNGRNDER